MEQTRIQWHCAFYAAMMISFYENKKHLEFQTEVILTKKPIQLDLLIIKNMSALVLKNEIGAMFQKYNVIEYKSPDASMNIDTFYKVQAYACLYKVMDRKVDEYKADEITVTFMRDSYPRKLIYDLQAQGCSVDCVYPGVYYVTGRVMFTTQIVVISQLEGKEQIWLQSLKRRIEQNKFDELMDNVNSLKEEDKKQLAGAVVEVVARANENCMDQWKKEGHFMYETLRRIFADEIRQEKEQAIEQAVEESRTLAIEQGRSIGLTEGRAEGRAEGRTEGQNIRLITQVSKKLQKGKDVNTIADELEEQPDVVKQICEAVETCGAECDAETIYKKMKKMIACL